MKIKINRYLFGLLALLVVFPALCFAQTNFDGTNAVLPSLSDPPAPAAAAAPAFNLQGLLLALIPVLVPLLIAFIKHFIQFLPLWTLPIVAASLGVLLDWLTSFFAGSANPLIGAAAGLTGVGLRELIDQTNKRIKFGKSSSILILCFFVALGTAGCAGKYSLENIKPAAVAPGQDAALVNAERVHVSSLGIYEELTVWEYNNRARLPVEVSRAVDKVRNEFPKAWREADTVLQQYRDRRGQSTEDVTRLTAALSAIQDSMLRLKVDNTRVSPLFTALSDLSKAVQELRK